MAKLTHINALVAAAVEPLRAIAMQSARDSAYQFATQQHTLLIEAGMDARRSHPRSRGYATATALMREARNLILRLTDPVDEFRSMRPTEPDIRTRMIDARLEKYMASVAHDASIAFDAYVVKLSTKVGACESATIDTLDAFVWHGSTLTVVKANGTLVERWHTRHIVNFSKYGKPFNQWPTRRAR